jgi:hypothetical protein
MAKDDDLKRQLGTFVRAALAQLDSVREVVVQKSKAGRIQIDVAMLKRQRKDILVEIGTAVARLAATGKISEDDFPELSAPLSRLEALDEHIATEEARAERVGAGREGEPGAEPKGDDEDLDSGGERG